MNFHTVNIIIRHEFLTKVKKKSFLLVTFLAPLFFALMCSLPTILMMSVKEKAVNIAVIDESGIVLPHLADTPEVTYTNMSGSSLDELKGDIDGIGADGILYVSSLDSAARTVTASTYAKKPIGMEIEESIQSEIRSAIEDYRISTYEIEGLSGIMEDVKSDLKLSSYTIGEDGKETISETAIYMIISMLLGMCIYMFVTIFSGSVMSGVIEEKSSRVVEVLVSSVKSTELMFGKIIGVALVAITQFILWILLTFVIVTVVSGVAGVSLGDFAADQTAVMSAPMPEGSTMDMGMADPSAALASVAETDGENPMQVLFSTLSNIPLGTLAVSFIIYFFLGYLLYASLFAAIGSAVESQEDTTQLSIPITIPLMIGFFISFMAYKNPDSAVVFWGSMIPFTSPIVMLSRIPFGVPAWEIVVSIAVLLVTFVACAWVSAKIYKVGILVFGKKSTFKDLWKWLKQS